MEPSASAQQAAQEKLALAIEQNQQAAASTDHVGEHTYFARISGCTHIFKDGTAAVFVNGEYVTDRAVEIEQLEALCKLPHNFLISKEPVPLQNAPDYVLMREVGRTSPDGNIQTAQSHRGMVHSGALAALAAASRR